MAELNVKEKRKVMEAIKIVKDGDLAVLEKLIDFQELIEEQVAKIEEFSQKTDRGEFIALKKEISDEVNEMVESMQKLLAEADKRVTEQITKEVSEFEKAEFDEVDGKIDEIKDKYNNLVELIEGVRESIPELPPDVDLTDIYNQLEDLERKVKDLPQELSSQEVRDKLENLAGDERLDKSAIKGLDEIEKKAEEASKRPMGGGGARGVQLYIDGAKKGLASTINLKAGSGVSITHSTASGQNDVTVAHSGTVSGALTLEENASIALDPVLSADGKYTGTTITGTAGATLAFGDLIYLDPTDSRWELADANAASGADGDARGTLGMCVLAAAADGSATTILLNGVIRADTAFPALTLNAPVYVSETAGDIVVTQPTTADVVIRIVGVAIPDGGTNQTIFFNPSRDYITHT